MKFLIVLSVLAVASATPVPQEDSVVRLFLGNIVNCVNQDLGLCLKEQALKSTERLRSIRSLKLTDGLTILNHGPKEAKSLELATEPELRKRQVAAKLWESATDLLNNSELEVSFDASADETPEAEGARAVNDVGEGRGKKKEMKKKIKMLLPLVILAKAKAIALVVIALLVIAASLAKIAFLAKLAFIAKVIAILKHLLHKKHAEEEHGWIPHHEEHGHGGWEGGWSRSRNEANNLAYSAYAQ